MESDSEHCPAENMAPFDKTCAIIDDHCSSPETINWPPLAAVGPRQMLALAPGKGIHELQTTRQH